MAGREGRSTDYRVGRGRPPLDTRFKPGQSGNPRGRPRGRKNGRTVERDFFKRKTRMQENGKIRSIAVQEAILIAMFNRALKGDLKAGIELLRRADEVAESPQRIPPELDRCDPHEAMEEYLRTVMGQNDQ